MTQRFLTGIVVFSFLVSSGQGQPESDLRAIFDRVALSFRTIVEPGGTQPAWSGGVLTGENRTAHRSVIDRGGAYFLIYRIQLDPLSDPQRFRLSILPPEPDAVSRVRARVSPQAEQLELPEYPPAREVGFGDVVMLDVLEDPSRALKVIDTMAVVDPWRDPGLRGSVEPPRDFTLADVELKMMNYRLQVDGMEEYESGGGCSGALIWFHLPGHGRFLFSIIDHPGYGFERIGLIRDDRIAFEWGGTRYEWISDRPVLQPGVWRLWVRADLDYRPPIDVPETLLLIGAADRVGSLLEPVR